MNLTFSKRNIYGGIFFVGLFFIFSRFFFQGPNIFERLTAQILFPIISIQSKIAKPLANYWKNKKDLNALLSQFSSSQEKVEKLEAENIELASALNRFDASKDLDRYRSRYKEFVVTGQIILKQISETGHYIFIDQGYADGIETEMIAVYRNNIVGKVDTVFRAYSRIVLVTDSSCKISAFCNQAGVKGIYEGRMNIAQAELMHVDHMQSLKEEDLLLSSGEGLVYPFGFCLGKIKTFENNGISYNIFVEPLIDLSKLSYCSIIKSKLNL